MNTPSRPKSENVSPRRIGIFRFSAVEFLIALILFFASAPFVESMPLGFILDDSLMTLVLMLGALAVGQKRWALTVAGVLAVPAVAARWMFHLFPDLVPNEIFLILGLLFVTFVIARLMVFILRAPLVNSEVLCAGLSAYLLLGLLWSFAYALVAKLDPHAFITTISSLADKPVIGFKALYFSLITLSTVGYGDIVPVSNVARMLAAMEAITGTLFIAVLIARLVALYSSQHSATRSNNPVDSSQQTTNTER
jgi:Ion channel